LRVLAGPFDRSLHAEYMRGAFEDADTITFGHWEGSDVVAAQGEDVRSVLDQLPEGWSPDLMLWWRPEYTVLPRGLAEVPFPVVMLTSDWYLSWQGTLAAARYADLVVTGSRGAPVFRAAGVDDVVALPMLGFEPGLDGVHVSAERDVDVLCAGNTRWSIHPERARVVDTLCDLPPSVRFVHPPFVDRAEYNRWLGRSKIFVNQTVIGEVNMKVYEAPAAGACLFVERDNLDVRDVLVEGESVVLFDREDLVDSILYYLEHDEEREAIAAAGREAMRGHTYRRNMRAILDHVRSRGRDRLLAARRGGQRVPKADESRRWAAQAVSSLFIVTAGFLERIDRATATGTARDVAIRCVAHRRSLEIAEEHGVVSPGDSAEELATKVEAATDQSPGDPCLDTFAFSFALARDDEDAAMDHFRRLVRHLEEGRPIPEPETAIWPLEKDRQYRLQRAMWEAVERGESPDPVVRAHVLDACLVAAARYDARKGRMGDAITKLRRATEVHPEGAVARPLLAGLLRDHGDVAASIEHFETHLERCPLDFEAAFGRLVALARCGRHAKVRGELERFRRRIEVLGRSEWRPLVGKLERILGQAAPHAGVVGSSR
jgi:hypothetical protein